MDGDGRATVGTVLGLTADRVVGLLADAGRAPSLHNSQPWRFGLHPDTIEIHADEKRRLAVADPTGRDVHIACGAALYNLRLGLLGLGIRPLVTVLPDPARPHLLATVRHGGRKELNPELRRLLEAIPRRHTNRRPFSEEPAPAAARHAMRRAAIEEGVWLDLVEEPDRRIELGRLARLAHTRQMTDDAFRAELTSWTGHDGDRADGVPAAAGGPAPAPDRTRALRDVTGGRAAGRGPASFGAEPLITVLSAHGDDVREELRAGQALQRVLLTATVHGLAVSFLSQLVELPDVRERMRRIINGTRPPLVVMRIGHGLPAAPAPRLTPAETVLGTTLPT